MTFALNDDRSKLDLDQIYTANSIKLYGSSNVVSRNGWFFSYYTSLVPHGIGDFDLNLRFKDSTAQIKELNYTVNNSDHSYQSQDIRMKLGPGPTNYMATVRIQINNSNNLNIDIQYKDLDITGTSYVKPDTLPTITAVFTGEFDDLIHEKQILEKFPPLSQIRHQIQLGCYPSTAAYDKYKSDLPQDLNVLALEDNYAEPWLWIQNNKERCSIGDYFTVPIQASSRFSGSQAEDITYIIAGTAESRHGGLIVNDSVVMPLGGWDLVCVPARTPAQDLITWSKSWEYKTTQNNNGVRDARGWYNWKSITPSAAQIYISPSKAPEFTIDSDLVQAPYPMSNIWQYEDDFFTRLPYTLQTIIQPRATVVERRVSTSAPSAGDTPQTLNNNSNVTSSDLIQYGLYSQGPSVDIGKVWSLSEFDITGLPILNTTPGIYNQKQIDLFRELAYRCTVNGYGPTVTAAQEIWLRDVRTGNATDALTNFRGTIKSKAVTSTAAVLPCFCI